ncbi:CBS domain-containing protein [Rhodocyclus tenuis]|uniref:DUF294 nucleotidyltransferase-like domain-containing protein n=1 Tax=Rhodocyclus gracilis TaxID=2929842 RepID=UPI001298A413|nr:DUF294 nucleotidyltransferase-like domain-containing protein [Rhodocyclus gracilis]MRD71864.1 CBS domain-containing protein [Rhodocyclus gracilis]
MSNSATQMLVAAALEFLRRHPPFDRMEAEALHYLAERLKLAYYEKDAPIASPEMGVLRNFYLLQRGKVLVRGAGEVGLIDYTTMTLSPGESFPIGAVTAQRPSTNVYTALEDVFCYELAVEDYFAVMRMSPVFNLFCTQYIATLANQSRQQLQQEFAQRAAEQQTMNSPLSSIITKEAICASPETSLREVIGIMAASHIGSIIVVDAEKRPAGIFTQSDVLKRVVLPGVPLESPIASVMSPDPHTLPMASSAYDAVLAMAMHGIRHVLVIDEGGRLKGVVSERDLFALQRVGLRQIRQSIETAPDIRLLCQAASDVRRLALNMLAQGVGAEQLTQFISALNDTLTRRVIQLNLDRHDLYGIDWAWLSFGSEGRDEQTFSTDQDNGLIFVCTDIMDREQTQLRLLDFARDINADLDRVGFPLCPGKIMAGNPEWCLTVEEWEEKFLGWVRTPEPKALLNASIFFDFRPLYGQFHLAHRLRLSLLKATQENRLFLRMMAQNALSVAPPLGKIRDFVTDADPEFHGTIDLKKYGARLFVDAARVFALAAGVGATNTAQRLRLTGAAQKVSSDESAGLVESLNFIQLLRLRHQNFELEQGRAGNNRIDPDELNELDRRILKEAFRQARKLQQRLKLDFQV